MTSLTTHGIMMYHRLRLKYLRSLRKVIPVMLVFVCLVVLSLYRPSADPDLALLLASNADVDLVVSDLHIVRCVRNCLAPKGYQKLEPALNYRAPGLFNYFVVVKKQPLNEATRVLVDIVSPALDADTVAVGPYAVGVKYIAIDPLGEIPDVDMVRSVEILMGMDDLVDAREGWKSLKVGSLMSAPPPPPAVESPGSIPSPLRRRLDPVPHAKIAPIITFFKLSPSREQPYTTQRQQFEALKRLALFPISSDKLKVLQLSDLHFGQSLGRCIDQVCSSDLRTLRFIDDTIRAENPDLIIITGDLIDLARTVDYKSVLLKVLQPILRNNIKFIFTFGDEFVGLDNLHVIKLSILTFLSTLPNCYNVVNNDPNLYGLSNYNLRVVQDEKDVAYITLLDSHDQQLHESQMNYLYRLNSQESSVFKLLFFHYPLPQFRPSGRFKLLGTYNEKHPLNSKTSEKFLSDIYNCGYNVVSVGHEHENDACISSEFDKINNQKKIWLCYSAITGDSGSTNINKDYDRKVRFYEVNSKSRKLYSWKRSEVHKKPFDYQLIHEF